jgi:hypothetical protein
VNLLAACDTSAAAIVSVLERGAMHLASASPSEAHGRVFEQMALVEQLANAGES